MEKSYNPKSFEDEIYKQWEEEGCFRAETDDNKVPFTIMMPPPNITGQLHMGHALDETYQDTLIRFKRMQGYCALWLPGTDHASIATEVKIVEQLKKQGINKEDLSREEFLKLAWDWKEKYGGRIVTQLKKLGSSCDWSRLAFTMDKKCSRAVREVFVNLYNKGLIYHGNRIINWCPECRTALSDAEVEYTDEDSFFWHIKYYLEGSDTEGLVVATTRPETMFGDTAVAVNPADERYKKYIGKNVILPIINKPIPVVAGSPPCPSCPPPPGWPGRTSPRRTPLPSPWPPSRARRGRTASPWSRCWARTAWRRRWWSGSPSGGPLTRCPSGSAR